jgi:hypothetical protein
MASTIIGLTVGLLVGAGCGCFEHFGLVGGFLFVAWYDVRQRHLQRIGATNDGRFARD